MADMDIDEPKEYRWETGYEKTWEAIKEDDSGHLDSAIAELIQKAKRKRQSLKTQNNRLGMMRHLFVVIDCSEAMSLPDMKPTRMMCTTMLMSHFVEEFFDQNPISQMGLIALKNRRADKISPLSGTPTLHLKALYDLETLVLTGEPSLQCGLDLALHSLKLVPMHASREVLIVMGSLTTCDSVDVTHTVAQLRKEGIRCSVISLSAEIHVCRQLAEQTNGTYGAIMDDAHFRDQLLAHIQPPQATRLQKNMLIKMGFPHPRTDEGKEPMLSMCICHIESVHEPSKLNTAGHYCPQCYSKYCELPVECQVCGLTLASAPHLARSYHHLFPLAHYTELPFNAQAALCFGCQKALTDQERHVYRCDSCQQIFCSDCDVFINDTMHTCVGCNTIPTIANQVMAHMPLASNGMLSGPPKTTRQF